MQGVRMSNGISPRSPSIVKSEENTPRPFPLLFSISSKVRTERERCVQKQGHET